MPINLICLMNRHCILFAKLKALEGSSDVQYLGNIQEAQPDFVCYSPNMWKEQNRKTF